VRRRFAARRHSGNFETNFIIGFHVRPLDPIDALG